MLNKKLSLNRFIINTLKEIQMKLQPLYDRIIIKRDAKEDTTESGIILSQTTEKPNQGVVVAVGHGTIIDNGTIVPLSVKEGDRVLFNRGTGVEVQIDGSPLIVMKEHEILALVV